jgi:hypothetical protein
VLHFDNTAGQGRSTLHIFGAALAARLLDGLSCHQIQAKDLGGDAIGTKIFASGPESAAV